MSSQRQEDELPRLRRRDEIDEIFARANPNPNREGCPPKDVLIALARRERPINDPGYVHLTQCSPCYLEVRAYQEQRASERRRRFARVAAAAILVIAVAAAGWFFIPGTGSPATAVRAELDLRPYALMRSEGESGSRPPLALPRGRVTLTILLPVGSEPGPYEVQVLDSELTSRALSPGSAEIKDYVTTLQATVDLSSLSTGPYQLAIRRTGQEWQFFPAEVR